MSFDKITPIIPVADLENATDWFKRCLGFSAQAVGVDMVHLSRDAAHIRLVLKVPDMDMSDPKRQQSVYIDVTDVDAVYATYRTEMEAAGKDCAPFDRPYGMREIHIIYESLLIYLGQPIATETP